MRRVLSAILKVTLFACLLFSLAAGSLSTTSFAIDYSFKSDSMVLGFERDNPGGGDSQFVPLYEYFSGSLSNIKDKPLSFHVSGWIKLDLGDDTGRNGSGGDIGNAFLQYNYPTGNGEVRLGRFFLAEGSAADIIDGIFFKVRTKYRFGGSIFAGSPVEHTITSTKTGSSIYGGRVFYTYPGITEVGLSYLRENGDFQGDDRENFALDFWFNPKGFISLTGNVLYNLATEGLAYQDYVVKAGVSEKVDLFTGYRSYNYDDYFQNALNSAFLAPAIDNTDQVKDFYLGADWKPVERLSLTGKIEGILHDLSTTGDAYRFLLDGRYNYGEERGIIGLTVGYVDADNSENTYTQLRGYITYVREKLKLIFDAITYLNDVAINGVKESYQVVGAATYALRPTIDITSDIQYTNGPNFKKDYQFFLKVSWKISEESGE